jgi:hypothetical protein
MGLFCGDKCQCKRRCKSWFSGMPSMEDACKNACKGNAALTKEGFLCSGQYVDQLNFLSQYGYDPCTGDDIDFDDTAAGMAAGQSDEQWQRLQPILIGLGILIAAGLAVLFIAKTS